MRSLLIGFILLSYSSLGQAFYFNNTTTTLVKNTSQSPAHWYIEVFTNESVDTTLRWKTSFSNVPPQWGINFDNQDIYYPVIEDGDSADFTLHAGLAFPQKLIIGAHLNNTPANCSVFFDIYDPEDPTNVTQIEYRFIVSAASIEDLESEGIYLTKENGNYILDTQDKTVEFEVISLDGKTLFQEAIQGKSTLDLSGIANQNVIILMEYNGQIYSSRVFL